MRKKQTLTNVLYFLFTQFYRIKHTPFTRCNNNIWCSFPSATSPSHGATFSFFGRSEKPPRRNILAARHSHPHLHKSISLTNAHLTNTTEDFQQSITTSSDGFKLIISDEQRKARIRLDGTRRIQAGTNRFKLLLTILSIPFFLSSCSTKKLDKNTLAGNPMPSFQLLLMDSITYINSSTIPNDKPIVMLFVSPYCPHCREQTENIIANIKSLNKVRIYFLTTFSLDEIKQFNNQYGLSKYENIIVAQNNDFRFVDYFNISSIPFIAIYDKEKILKKVMIGKVDASRIRKIALN